MLQYVGRENRSVRGQAQEGAVGDSMKLVWLKCVPSLGLSQIRVSSLCKGRIGVEYGNTVAEG